jgi:hypothetical protein
VKTEIRYMEDAATQSLHDRSLIDHLISTFHSRDNDTAPADEPRRPVYDLIRTEWEPTFTFGTRR